MLHTNFDMAETSLQQGFLELAVARNISLTQWVFDVGHKWMILQELDVVFNELLLGRLSLISFDFVLIWILWVLVEEIGGVAVDTDLERVVGCLEWQRL